MTVTALPSLAGNFTAGSAIVAGIVGGLVFLAVVYMGLAVGMTRMNFLRMLGTMVAPNGSRSVVYSLGLMMHLMASAAFGLIHAGLLHAVGITTVASAARWDLLFGAANGLLVVAMMPVVLTAMHPLVRAHRMERPGTALTGFGALTPAGSLMAHVGFGVVAGAVYAAAVL